MSIIKIIRKFQVCIIKVLLTHFKIFDPLKISIFRYFYKTH